MPFDRISGLTLVELMVSLVVGLIVMLVAMSLMLSVQRSHDVQDDLLRIDEYGRHAMEVLARMVRHAGYAEAYEARQTGPALPAVLGIDASRVARNSAGIADSEPTDINGSDVLAVRHQVSGASHVPNCAGFRGPSTAEAHDSWSIFYVARDASGEPELYCKYEGGNGWSAEAIVAGVESFQVLYGVDGDDDGLPDRWLNAASIGAAHDARAWSQVVMVRMALLLRGQARQLPMRGAEMHDLFGSVYGETHGAADAGVRLTDAELARQSGERIRKVVTATSYLRNTSGKRVR